MGAAASAGEPRRWRRIAIVGGGCYGTFYAGQLARARRAGAAAWAEAWAVDRDPDCRFARTGGADGVRLAVAEWGPFLDGFLATLGADDAVVPSPLMPHLLMEWLLRRARARWPGRPVDTVPLADGPGLPYDASAPDGTRYLSYADWLCPVHCIEPGTCPRTRAPRTWEMADALADWAARLARGRPVAGAVALTCRHQVYGVGMIAGADLLAAEAALVTAGASGAPAALLVGTVSACHGAATLVRLG